MIRSEGFALVLVLWVLSLLTIMAGSFALSMRRESAIVSGISSNAKALAVAQSGLAIAELMLMNPDQRQRWLTDGSVYQIDYDDSKVRVRLLSETGKIDLNKADQVLLQGLMANAPVDSELQTKLVSAILDWRDADDLVHIDGAEKADYKKAGLSYQPRNKPFQSIEELQLVLGMNEQVYKWLENLITVHSGLANVDLTQATKEVLQVLPGMDAGVIDEFRAARRESAINGLPAPTFIARDGVYTLSQSGTGAAPVASDLGRTSRQQINTPETAINNAGAGQLSAMTVVTEALLGDGASSTIKILIKKSESATGSSPFQVLKWQRNDTNEGSLFADEQDELLVRQYAEPEFSH